MGGMAGLASPGLPVEGGEEGSSGGPATATFSPLAAAGALAGGRAGSAAGLSGGAAGLLQIGRAHV